MATPCCQLSELSGKFSVQHSVDTVECTKLHTPPLNRLWQSARPTVRMRLQ